MALHLKALFAEALLPAYVPVTSYNQYQIQPLSVWLHQRVSVSEYRCFAPGVIG